MNSAGKKTSDDHFVDLRSIARQVSAVPEHVKIFLSLKLVSPVRDCESPAFCLYWLSDVNTVFPNVTF